MTDFDDQALANECEYKQPLLESEEYDLIVEVMGLRKEVATLKAANLNLRNRLAAQQILAAEDDR